MRSTQVYIFSTTLAVVALVPLWKTEYTLLWWIIVFLIMANWFVQQTINTAIRIEAKTFVVRTWKRVQIITNSLCFAAGLAGLLYALR